MSPSYVEDSNPGSLAPESGILPPSHGASSDGDSAVVGDSLFHNLTVLGKNEKGMLVNP